MLGGARADELVSLSGSASGRRGQDLTLNKRDIVVFGASAGGVEALRALVAHLPEDLPVSVLVVLHMRTGTSSALPRILDRAGPLPSEHARDGERLEPGHVYVAPPDRHLLVRDGRVRLSAGPRENGHRPAVDPLFRTAARAHGARVVGVVLSGALDDGTAGLAAVKRHGGLAVVQEPAEALYPDMPLHAAATVDVDHVLPVMGIAELIALVANETTTSGGDPAPEPEEDPVEMRLDPNPFGPRQGRPSPYACPDCNGVLWEVDEGGVMRFRCRVGHAWSPNGLLAEQADRLEDALWTALRVLEEHGALARRLAERAEERGAPASVRHFASKAESWEEQATTIMRILMAGQAEPAEPESDPEGLPVLDEGSAP